MFGILRTGPDLPVRTGPDVDALYHRHRTRIIVAITTGYAVSYMCRLAINVVKKPLIDGGVFTPAELGTIGSALFYAYALGKLVNGFVADHANARRFFALGLLLSAVCNIGMGFSSGVAAAAVLWGFNGWFQSFGAPACVTTLAAWFSNRERGRFYGIWSSAHSLGEGLTFAVVSSAVAWLGWRWGFWAPAAATLVAMAASYAVMADRPRTLGLPSVADWRDDRYAPSATPPPARSVFATQMSILRIPAVWVIALSSAAAYVTRYAINSWGILYLQEVRGYSLVAAGSMLTVSTVAGVLGALGIGYVSDKAFGARRPPANLLFGVIELIGLLLFFFAPGGTPVLVIALVLFGFGMTGIVTSLGGLFAIDVCPKRVAGAALGMVGVFSYIGAGIQERVSGTLIDRGMTIAGGVRHYDFAPAIWFWVGSSMLSLLLATTLWRTKLRD